MAAKKKTVTPKVPTEPNTTALLAPMKLTPDATQALSAADKVVVQASLMVVKDQASADAVGAVLVQLKDWQKQVKAKRDVIVKPLKDHVKTLEALFKPTMDKLETAEAALKNQVSNWFLKEQQRRSDEQAKLLAKASEAQAAGRNSKAIALAQKANTVGEKTSIAPVGGGGVAMRMQWTFEVTDQGAVPHEYFTVDEKKIAAAVKAGVREIPGIRIFEKPVAAVST